MTIAIDETIAARVLETVDAGLCGGIGSPEPGQMCVEAAVCFALGLPHSDDPPCVSRALRALKILLNDADWSSNSTRAKGLRRLSILQLGSDGINEIEFVTRLAAMAIEKIVPRAAKSAESAAKYAAEYAVYAAKYAAVYATAAKSAAESAVSATAAKSAAKYAEYAAESATTTAKSAAESAKYAAYAAESAKYAAAYDSELTFFATEVENILIDMQVPGVRWLELLEQELNDVAQT